MKIKAGQKLYQIEGDQVKEVEVEQVGTKFFYLKTDSSWRTAKIDKEHLETQFFLTEAAAKERLELEAFQTRFQAIYTKALNIGLAVGDRIQPWYSGARKVNELGKSLESRVRDDEIVTILEIMRYSVPGALLKVQDDKGDTFYVLSRNFIKV